MLADSNEIAGQIRQELRGVLRLWKDLRTPIERFEPFRATPGDPYRYYVQFDVRPRRRIKGLQIGLKSLSVPDERIQDQVLEFAKAVWQLKDRLRQWAKAVGARSDVEVTAKKNTSLLVCSDLANLKKHGRCENRSGLNPHLGTVRFDTSESGMVEFFYDGATKEKELIVSRPVPIPFRVDVKTHDGSDVLGDAVEIIADAFKAWLPVIEELGVLSADDPETRRLRELLRPLEDEGQPSDRAPM